MQHHYSLQTIWTGNTQLLGTSHYTSFERSFETIIDNKAVIYGSSDPAFRGDNSKHNPEELLLAAISSCHMLWFLHLCANEKIIVESYVDHATAQMEITEKGGGHFTIATLNITLKITNNVSLNKINTIHKEANQL
jgi:organic hydroperoxide reductase OsmC/OhrA